jgi:DNA-directed RNA polymerase specialized sigma24 family protein
METQMRCAETPRSTTLYKGREMYLATRSEHGNVPVRVYSEDSETRYELHANGTKLVFGSARALMRHLYGHDTSITFDRYFRIGKWRQRGRITGAADLLTLLDDKPMSTRATAIAVHGSSLPTPVSTDIAFDLAIERDTGVANTPYNRENVKHGEFQGDETSPDPLVAAFLHELEGDLRPYDDFVVPSSDMMEAFDKAFQLEMDRVEGRVGIDLAQKSGRGDAKTRSDEVRKLLWSGFAGKMLSQGYDPEDVLQEVYRGLLVRNRGKCPWDVRKSTFGHYVHLVVSCVLTNYHRKQVRRVDRNALSMDVGTDGEERGDAGQWGSCKIWHGSDAGDRLALEELSGVLRKVLDPSPEATLGREILPLVSSGHSRAEIAREMGVKPSMVSRALTWLRRQAARWAEEGGLRGHVPKRHLVAS